MTDIHETTLANSKQLTADDLRGITRTIKITGVSVIKGDQPVVINYEGENGKPYMPCKSMRRVLKNIWGSDGTKYIGKSLTIYCDDKVMFGGMEVGGIRISHASDIDREVILTLTSARASKKPYKVKPLVPASAVVIDPVVRAAGEEAAAAGVEDYTKWLASLTPEVKETVRSLHNEWTKKAKEADES